MMLAVLIVFVVCWIPYRYLIVNIMLTVRILKFGTPQTIAIIVLKIEKFDVTLH